MFSALSANKEIAHRMRCWNIVVPVWLTFLISTLMYLSVTVILSVVNVGVLGVYSVYFSSAHMIVGMISLIVGNIGAGYVVRLKKSGDRERVPAARGRAIVLSLGASLVLSGLFIYFGSWVTSLFGNIDIPHKALFFCLLCAQLPPMAARRALSSISSTEGAPKLGLKASVVLLVAVLALLLGAYVSGLVGEYYFITLPSIFFLGETCVAVFHYVDVNRKFSIRFDTGFLVDTCRESLVLLRSGAISILEVVAAISCGFIFLKFLAEISETAFNVRNALFPLFSVVTALSSGWSQFNNRTFSSLMHRSGSVLMMRHKTNISFALGDVCALSLVVFSVDWIYGARILQLPTTEIVLICIFGVVMCVIQCVNLINLVGLQLLNRVTYASVIAVCTNVATSGLMYALCRQWTASQMAKVVLILVAMCLESYVRMILNQRYLDGQLKGK
ncbi:MAG: hypothetical protein H6R00_1676 [Proteobacteria bacterium]|nr:hypothetical protein [Pseudomonadota bacterium]